MAVTQTFPASFTTTTTVEVRERFLPPPRFDGRAIHPASAYISVALLFTIVTSLFAMVFGLVEVLSVPPGPFASGALIGAVVGALIVFAFLMMMGARPEGHAAMRVVWWVAQQLRRLFGRAVLEERRHLEVQTVRVRGLLRWSADEAGSPRLSWEPDPDSRHVAARRRVEQRPLAAPPSSPLDTPIAIDLIDGRLALDLTRPPAPDDRVCLELRDLPTGLRLPIALPLAPIRSTLPTLERPAIQPDDPDALLACLLPHLAALDIGEVVGQLQSQK